MVLYCVALHSGQERSDHTTHRETYVAYISKKRRCAENKALREHATGGYAWDRCACSSYTKWRGYIQLNWILHTVELGELEGNE